MAIGIEHEPGMQAIYFRNNKDRYLIDTEALPQINTAFTLLVNQTFGKIEWNPKFMELVPIIALFGTLDFPQDYRWINERIKKYKMANLVIGNYISYKRRFFEEGRRIPDDWNKVPEILCLGTIARETITENQPLIKLPPLLVSSLSGREISLSDVKTLKDARALMYKL